MAVVALLVIALAVWVIDSGVRNRPPLQTLKSIIGTGKFPEIGVTYPPATLGAGGLPVTANPSTGGGGASGSAPTTPVSGTVNGWISQAISILEANGYSANQLNASDIGIIVMGESGGDPHAQNNTDINAQEGHPSKGLVQTIDSTFNAWALPGHTDIWNPVDNIIAGVRYALGRYHNLDQVPGVIQVHNGERYTAGY
jgi:hypothetical protein